MPEFTQQACTQISLQQNIPLTYDSEDEYVRSNFICKAIYFKMIDLCAVPQLHELCERGRF
jgi:hypothetical protein